MATPNYHDLLHGQHHAQTTAGRLDFWIYGCHSDMGYFSETLKVY